jgi:hypothetical protein
MANVSSDVIHSGPPKVPTPLLQKLATPTSDAAPERDSDSDSDSDSNMGLYVQPETATTGHAVSSLQTKLNLLYQDRLRTFFIRLHTALVVVQMCSIIGLLVFSSGLFSYEYLRQVRLFTWSSRARIQIVAFGNPSAPNGTIPDAGWRLVSVKPEPWKVGGDVGLVEMALTLSLINVIASFVLVHIGNQSNKATKNTHETTPLVTAPMRSANIRPQHVANTMLSPRQDSFMTHMSDGCNPVRWCVQTVSALLVTFIAANLCGILAVETVVAFGGLVFTAQTLELLADEWTCFLFYQTRETTTSARIGPTLLVCVPRILLWVIVLAKMQQTASVPKYIHIAIGIAVCGCWGKSIVQLYTHIRGLSLRGVSYDVSLTILTTLTNLGFVWVLFIGMTL